MQLGKLYLLGDRVGSIGRFLENLQGVDRGVDQDDLVGSISIEVQGRAGFDLGLGAAAAVLVKNLEPVLLVELENANVASRGDHQARSFPPAEHGQGGWLELRELPLSEVGLLAEVLEGGAFALLLLEVFLEKEDRVLVWNKGDQVCGAIAVAVEESQSVWR